MANLSTWLYTKLFGRFVGSDPFGNAYYENKKPNRSFGRKGRWVIYKGEAEPSKVPAYWFNWLHFQTDEKPTNQSKEYAWEQEHTPNLTGTKHAYYPKGSALGGAKRSKAKGDYEAWQPK